MSHVFLSFAGADRETAAMVVQRLGGEGVQVWWDEHIDWGGNWMEAIEQALTNATAYVILVGASGIRRWVKPELQVALRRHWEDGLPVFPLLLLPGITPEQLPPFLATVQARPLTLDPAQGDFAALAERLKRAQDKDSPLPAPGIDTGRAPFPGLEAFQGDDAPFFFGRQVETLRALQRFGPTPVGTYHRWLQVEGASGTGKSSLVRAGLLPAIARGWLGEDEQRAGTTAWRIAAPMRPGADPIENLATALGNLFGIEIQTLDTRLRNKADKNARALRLLLREAKSVPPGQGLVLVVDQFEELFTLTRDAALRSRFDALLGEALADLDGPLHLITTIRNDFTHRLAELPRLQMLLDDGPMGDYRLPPITPAGLCDVVRSPARLAGLRWSDDDLPQEIIDKAVRELGILPLVGNLLRLLWEEQQRRGDNVLSRRDYSNLGGLAGALAKRADLLLDALGADGRERARCLLLALVEPVAAGQAVRRTISKTAALRAAGGGVAAEQVLNRLAGARDARTPEHARAMPRLVTLSDPAPTAADAAESLVDLAHEALLRDDRNGKPYWPKLRGWVYTEREQLQSRQIVERLAESWGKGTGGLVTGRHLRAFRPLLKSCVALSDQAEGFLRQSLHQARVRAAAAGTVAIIVLGILGVFGYWINREDMRPSMAFFVLAGKAGWILRQPEMIEIRPGEGAFPRSFEMGCVSGQGCQDNELPVRQVTFDKPFAVGKFEVTFEEYELFARLTQRDLPSTAGWRVGSRPIINVTWEEARHYAKWLREQTHKPYRLPSEAEWEYAARAGTTTPFSTGACIDPDLANYDGSSNWRDCPVTRVSRGQTEEVGAFAPNPWGLHEVHGNVWEWVEDCWHGTYEGAPTDGKAWLEADGGDCGRRVLRGGSWGGRPETLRSAFRIRNYADNRFWDIGFRLARDL